MLLTILGLLVLGVVVSLIFPNAANSNDGAAPNKRQKKSAANTEGNPIEKPGLADVTWEGNGEFLFDLVGESNYQSAIKELAGDHGDREPKATFIARMIPENDNPYDDKAIRVEINKKLVGYMSKDDARSFRRRLGTKKLTNQTTTCYAKIIGGWRGRDGNRVSYGIRLDIKPFW